MRVLELARELGLLRVGTVAVDGTKLWANASKGATWSALQVEQELEFLEREVEELLEKAELADSQQSDDGGKLPRQLAQRAQRRAKLEAARLALKQKAQQRAQAAAQERARAEREGCERPRPRAAQVRPNDSVNTTDMQSTLQPTAREGFIQGYNAQAAVCVESRLLLGAHVVSDTGDRRQLAPTVAAIPPEVGVPEAIIADTGYDNAVHILQIERTTVGPSRRYGGIHGKDRPGRWLQHLRILHAAIGLRYPKNSCFTIRSATSGGTICSHLLSPDCNFASTSGG